MGEKKQDFSNIGRLSFGNVKDKRTERIKEILDIFKVK